MEEIKRVHIGTSLEMIPNMDLIFSANPEWNATFMERLTDFNKYFNEVLASPIKESLPEPKQIVIEFVHEPVIERIKFFADVWVDDPEDFKVVKSIIRNNVSEYIDLSIGLKGSAFSYLNK